MLEQKPIRTFNVCDEEGTKHEVQVFQEVLKLNSGEDTLGNFKLEVMVINKDCILIENGTNVFMANAENNFKEFRPC